MTNYADPTAVRAVDLGPCRCPVANSPHERDSAVVRVRLGYAEKGRVRQTARLEGLEAGQVMLGYLGTDSWNLLLPNGQPRPLTLDQVGALDDLTLLGREKRVGRKAEVDVAGLLTYLAEAMVDDPLPNASSGPSPAGTPESSTPIPTTQTPPTSTTG